MVLSCGMENGSRDVRQQQPSALLTSCGAVVAVFVTYSPMLLLLLLHMQL